MTIQSTAPKRDLRYVSIEPGRISLHGVSLTDGEYAVLRGIAERMKRIEPVSREPIYIDGWPQC